MKRSTFIYMSHEVRVRKPKKPVIVVQRGKTLWRANTVKLVDRETGKPLGEIRFRSRGLRNTPWKVRGFVKLYGRVRVQK